MHGNTIVIIEHNLDVIKTADWLIDMGPEGGAGGGTVGGWVPEELAANPASHTGGIWRRIWVTENFESSLAPVYSESAGGYQNKSIRAVPQTDTED